MTSTCPLLGWKCSVDRGERSILVPNSEARVEPLRARVENSYRIVLPTLANSSAETGGIPRGAAFRPRRGCTWGCMGDSCRGYEGYSSTQAYLPSMHSVTPGNVAPPAVTTQATPGPGGPAQPKLDGPQVPPRASVEHWFSGSGWQVGLSLSTLHGCSSEHRQVELRNRIALR